MLLDAIIYVHETILYSLHQVTKWIQMGHVFLFHENHFSASGALVYVFTLVPNPHLIEKYFK